jgi:hypothetical protein
VSDRGRNSGRKFNVVCKGRIRVMAKCCPTCIFLPGNLMLLRPGRLREMVEGVREIECVIPCHETLGQEEQALCLCQFNAAKQRRLQVAEELGLIVWARQ